MTITSATSTDAYAGSSGNDAQLRLIQTHLRSLGDGAGTRFSVVRDPLRSDLSCRYWILSQELWSINFRPRISSNGEPRGMQRARPPRAITIWTGFAL